MQYQKNKNGSKKGVYLAQDIWDKIIFKFGRNQLAGTFSWDDFICAWSMKKKSKSNDGSYVLVILIRT